MKTPKYSVFTVFAVLDDFEMHSARHGEDVPATLRTARLTGRGMRERCGAGQELHVKVVHSV